MKKYSECDCDCHKIISDKFGGNHICCEADNPSPTTMKECIECNEYKDKSLYKAIKFLLSKKVEEFLR